jgi:hypothetical protein
VPDRGGRRQYGLCEKEALPAMKRLVVFSIICVCLLAAYLMCAAEIKDSESTTHGVDTSSHSIVDTYTFPGFKVIQFTLPVLSVYSYMLISDGDALLVTRFETFLSIWKRRKKKVRQSKGFI